MKQYCIRTFAKEDKPEMVCKYDYRQYKEVIEMLKRNNEEFTTWTEEVFENLLGEYEY